MNKKYLIIIFSFCLFLNQNLKAQSYKSQNLYINNYVFPESYLPANYSSFGVKIKFSDQPIYIVVDGEKKSSRNALSFNEFFKEKDLVKEISGTNSENVIQGDNIPTLLELGYTGSDIESKNHFIIKMTIKNVAIESKISENTSLETPFTYDIYYKFDVVFELIDSVSKEVFMNKIFNINEKTLSPGGFEGYKAGFKTKAEAVSYLSANSDKNLIFNELIKNIQNYTKTRLVSWIDVAYYRDNFYFSRISKEDKNPLFLKLNQDVDALEKWSENKGEPTFDDGLIAENTDFIEKNNLKINDKSIYFNDRTRLNNYKNLLKYKRVFTDFILKMNKYSKEFDSNDKGQKVALWASYVNIASSFEVLNNFESSLEYLRKAIALDYQVNKLKYIESEVEQKKLRKDVFFDANGVVKKDVNSNYLKYIDN